MPKKKKKKEIFYTTLFEVGFMCASYCAAYSINSLIIK